MDNNNSTPVKKRAHNFVDLTGQKFGQLTVIKEAPNTKNNGQAKWECICDCGGANVVYTRMLKNGQTKSCGCFRVKNSSVKATTHGHTQNRNITAEYRAYMKMKERCHNEKASGYRNYGGRGITICEEWLNDFQAFYDYIGKRPSNKHSIDRINNNGNYEPGNVRWATASEQSLNKRNNKRLTLNNQSKTLSEWGEFLGIQQDTLGARKSRGWCDNCTLTYAIAPVGDRKNYICTHKLFQQ